MINLHNVECLSFMRTMEDNSVDAIVTDPPYFGVKEDDWDNQWKNADHFIEWIGELSEQWQRILKPNGSLYCFASPQLRSRVEVKIGERFKCLPTITWVKNDGNVENSGGKWRQAEKEAMRSYFPRTEAIVFAEHFGADTMPKGGEGYKYHEGKLHSELMQPIKDYLNRERGELSIKDIDQITGTSMASHWFTHPTQWTIPTAAWYAQLQQATGRFSRPYEDLRQQYEDLRREYEDLRRPFNVTADVPYTDVWTFRTVQAYDGKHVCEKPIALMEHIILASTKPDAIVFDPFTGSGSTGMACVMNGRKFIGCEMDEHWHGYATKRINKASRQPRLFDAPKAADAVQLTLDGPTT
jgi:adenine-specific DNA-methyltransferase